MGRPGEVPHDSVSGIVNKDGSMYVACVDGSSVHTTHEQVREKSKALASSGVQAMANQYMTPEDALIYAHDSVRAMREQGNTSVASVAMTEISPRFQDGSRVVRYASAGKASIVMWRRQPDERYVPFRLMNRLHSMAYDKFEVFGENYHPTELEERQISSYVGDDHVFGRSGLVRKVDRSGFVMEDGDVMLVGSGTMKVFDLMSQNRPLRVVIDRIVRDVQQGKTSPGDGSKQR